MDDWLEQFQTELNEIAAASSKWLGQAARQGERVIEQLVDGSIEAIEAAEKSIDDNLAPAFIRLNDRVSDSLDAGLVFIDEQVTPWVSEATMPITNTVNPFLQNHPTCVGCRNYHGSDYGNQMLVCGMHPYGPDEENCADWESVWPDLSDEN